MWCAKLLALLISCFIYFPKEHDNATCLAASPDSVFIAVGKTDGLAVVDAENQTTLASLVEGNLFLLSLSISKIADQRYIISSIDDAGVWQIAIIYQNDLLKSIDDWILNELNT